LTRDVAHQYDLMDERVGVWTTIHEETDRVIVSLRATHARGRWFGLLITVAVVSMMLSSFVKYDWAPGIAFTAILVGAFFMWKQVRRSMRRPEGPVLTVMNGSSSGCDAVPEKCLWSASIQAVCLRRNSGCDISDMSKWQVYLWIADSPTARLIYQKPYSRRGRERARSVANRLGRRWGVEVTEMD
jgi:hypothetical protein